MTVCQDCSIDFYGLERDTVTCNKCVELDGKSEIEKSVIRVRVQPGLPDPDALSDLSL